MAAALAATVLMVAAAALVPGGPAQAQPALRPEIGKPLQAARELIEAGRYREALARVREADAVGAKHAGEALVIERMRIAAALGAADMDAAVRAFEVIDASGEVPAAQKLQMIESIAGLCYRAKDYRRAVQWYERYFEAGGSRAANRTLLIQAQYRSGDFASVTRQLTAAVRAAEKRGDRPDEDRLRLLRSAAVRDKDVAAETFALERLVAYYPDPDEWAALIAHVRRRPGFSDRLLLDVYRLEQATGSLTSAEAYVEMTQLALQAGLTAEARAVIDQGFASGALGRGTQAGRHQRLRALVLRQVAEAQKSQADDEAHALAAREGRALLVVGMNLVYAGHSAKGVRLMRQALVKGGLKRPDEAKLHLAIAELAAGDAARAIATLKTVEGADGTRALARLWALHARHGKGS